MPVGEGDLFSRRARAPAPTAPPTDHEDREDREDREDVVDAQTRHTPVAAPAGLSTARGAVPNPAFPPSGSAPPPVPAAKFPPGGAPRAAKKRGVLIGFLVALGVVVLVVRAAIVEDRESRASASNERAERIAAELGASVADSLREAAERRAAKPGAAPATSGTAAAAAEGDLGQPSASFTFHNTRPGYGSAFYVLGEVQNTSAVEIRKPEVIVIMLDAEGREVARDNGFALAETLLPNAKSYVSTIISDPPQHDKLAFEVVAHKATFVLPQSEGLEVKPNPPTHERSLVKFTGVVSNDGAALAKFVNVKALAFDAEDKLLGVYSTYVQADGLAAGESATFSFNGVGLTSPAARYEYQVSGRPEP